MYRTAQSNVWPASVGPASARFSSGWHRLGQCESPPAVWAVATGWLPAMSLHLTMMIARQWQLAKDHESGWSTTDAGFGRVSNRSDRDKGSHPSWPVPAAVRTLDW